jgi:hypothetical protein
MELLRNRLKECKSEFEQSIVNLKGKTSYKDLLETLLIIVETATYAEKLGRKDFMEIGLPTYSINTLTAINEILENDTLKKAFLPDNALDRSQIPMAEILALLLTKIEILELYEMIDEVNFDEYKLIKEEEGHYYTEFLGDLSKNRHYLELIKDKARKDFYTSYSKDLVSEDEFFKSNANLKTNEGFAAMFVQNAEVIESSQGTTWLSFEDENDLWNKVFNQHRAYYYRKTMESHYILKEEDKIKEIFVLLDKENDVKITIYSIIAMTAWIKATSQMLHNPVSLGWYNNKLYFSKIFTQFSINDSATEDDKEQNVINILHNIFYYYPALLENKQLNELVYWADIDIFIQQILNENDDLKIYTLEELKVILNYIVKLNLPGLRKNEKNLQIIPFAFVEIDHIDFVYSELICKDLYDTQNNKGQSNNENKSQIREKLICKKMEDLFKLKFKYAKANVGFKDNSINSGDLNGEFDLIVVDEDSKSALCIELKLKNTFPFNRKGKYEWFDDKILGKKKKIGAVQQVKKYYDYFHLSDCGKNQIKALFDLDIEMEALQKEGYKFFSLIVTDNFYFDHYQIIYDADRKLSTMLISFFELKILLENLELFEEGTKNWVLYHYFNILGRKGIKNEEIEKFRDDETQKEATQEIIDFINANKAPYFENENLTIPELIKVIRKENKLWQPFHFWEFE